MARKCIPILALAWAASCGAAAAADLDPVVTERMTFDGAYIGLQAGLGGFRSGFSSDADLLPNDHETKLGALLGGHAGYGVSVGRIYLGVEGELQGFVGDKRSESIARTESGSFGAGVGSIVGGSGSSTSVRYILTATERFEHDLKENGALKARLGYDIGGVMPYASAGVAAGRIETSYLARIDVDTNRDGTITRSRLAEASGSDTDIGVGYTVGGGLEVALGNGFSVRDEYAFTDLGDKRYEFEFKDETVGKARFDTMLHQGRVGVSYRF